MHYARCWSFHAQRFMREDHHPPTPTTAHTHAHAHRHDRYRKPSGRLGPWPRARPPFAGQLSSSAQPASAASLHNHTLRQLANITCVCCHAADTACVCCVNKQAQPVSSVSKSKQSKCLRSEPEQQTQAAHDVRYDSHIMWLYMIEHGLT